MKLDPRFVLPAALLAGALALPAAGTADPPVTGACPDHYLGPFPLYFLAPDKDKNDDLMLCVKQEDMHLIFKDDNCDPNCDQTDVQPNLDPSTLPSDALVDDILP